ncbi:hypothetical protein TRVA0_009S01156 [Trichomonascus vanleenenianus]|uniref:uncharacterized protein n=1 Tax=Trichomonascus vanleenenianus TaxID=2268995 RepID=UPI003EC98CE9
MRNTHSVEVVQILNKFPRNVTQLTIISDSGKMGAISELTANLTSLRISEIYHDVASIQPLVTPHKSLCRVFLELYCMMGELKLPDTVTHLTIVAQLYDLNLTISGNHLKSLVARDMIFSPIAFLVPELEYLSICMGMIHDIDDLRQSPYPKLKALECDNLSDGRNVIQLLELSKPSQSIALTQKNGNLRGIPWRNLLFSKYLPPVVTLQLDPNQILHLADLYFIQRLLGQPATSNVYVTIRYLDISNPPDLTDIAPKYRTLVSSSLKHDEGYFQDTYKLCPDFINACLSDT